MTPEEFGQLKGKPSLIDVEELSSWEGRMLIYGYNLDRKAYEVKLERTDAEYSTFSRPEFVITVDDVETYRATTINAHRCIPDKRVYPERCDYEFCALLISRHIHIPFLSYSE